MIKNLLRVGKKPTGIKKITEIPNETVQQFLVKS